MTEMVKRERRRMKKVDTFILREKERERERVMYI